MKTAVIDVGGGFRGIYACKRTRNWLPASAKNIPMRRRSCGVSTLSRNAADMKRLYDKGYADGERVKGSILKYEFP